MKDLIKRELTSISNWIGALFIAVGNLLPYLTPETLTALGVPGAWVPRVSTAIGLLLIAYREKKPAEAPPVPFVQSPSEKKQ